LWIDPIQKEKDNIVYLVAAFSMEIDKKKEAQLDDINDDLS
jgi:hypothetical protein